MKSRCLLIICVFLLPLLAPAASESESTSDDRIPLEAFTRLPRARSIQLSPNGEYLAMLRNHKGTTFLMTQKPYSAERPVYVIRNEREKNKIQWYKWANDERLLVSVGFASYRNGISIQESRLVAVNRDGSNLENIVKDEGKRGRPARWETQFRDRVISFLPDDKDHILIGLDHKSRLSLRL